MMTFRDRVDSAIEAHDSLDTSEFRQFLESADGDDRAYWTSQVLLDRAIADWQDEFRPRRSFSSGFRRAAAALAVTAAGLAAGWLTVSSNWNGDAVSKPTVRVVENDVALETDGPMAAMLNEPRELAMMQPSGGTDQFAEAAQTAERLAYAFEPVGERVGTVVRFLVDAVPGSDVFAM